MTGRARVVVIGATEEDPPPGVGTVAEVVELVVCETAGEVAGALPGTDVVLAWRAERELLEDAWEGAGDLRWIQAASAGVDRLLFPALVQSHVVVTNARGVFDEAIAEYVLGVLLVFAKDLAGVLERQRRAEWLHRETERLAGTRILIVGVGSIGRAIARSCRPLGLRVRGVARTARPREEPFESIDGIDTLVGAVRWADVVVDALPATEETRHVFGEHVFAAMRPAARFVNVGRGSTVDEDALVRALEGGTLAAAALDVFEHEPLSAASPLWTMPNVIVSPHMSGDTVGWRETVMELFVENLERYLTARPLRNVVDKTRGYVPS